MYTHETLWYYTRNYFTCEYAVIVFFGKVKKKNNSFVEHELSALTLTLIGMRRQQIGLGINGCTHQESSI